MTNFPTYDDSEPCDRYDPRYRPFYVETATPEAKDVVLVMDTSWSMTGDKLRVAKEAAITVLDTMNPKDQVSNIQLCLKRGQVSFVVLDKDVPKLLNEGQNFRFLSFFLSFFDEFRLKPTLAT